METVTMTLTEFLLARIAEDEAVAHSAIESGRPGATWQWVTSETDVVVPPGDEGEALEHQDISLRTVEEFPTQSVGPLPAFVIHTVEEGIPGALTHIARHDPARVLAECEAKRRIVEMHRDGMEPYYYEGDGGDRSEAYCVRCSVGHEGERWPCATLRTLALVYADHPDYRDEWRP